MGGRSADSGGGSDRFKMPKFTNGSEKQQAWAGRILSGFDDSFTANIKQATKNQATFKKRGVPSEAKKFANDAAALKKARSNYRASAAKQTDAVSIINNRERLARGVEGMMRRAIEQSGGTTTRYYDINVNPSR